MNKNKKLEEKYNNVCPVCMSSGGNIFVHGHYQCVDCKQNVDPCCSGEICEPLQFLDYLALNNYLAPNN